MSVADDIYPECAANLAEDVNLCGAYARRQFLATFLRELSADAFLDLVGLVTEETDERNEDGERLNG